MWCRFSYFQILIKSKQFYHVTYLYQFSTLDFTPMILVYLCNSNQLKESFSEDGVDSPKLVKQILILDNPYGHENSIPAVSYFRWFSIMSSTTNVLKCTLIAEGHPISEATVERLSWFFFFPALIYQVIGWSKWLVW